MQPRVSDWRSTDAEGFSRQRECHTWTVYQQIVVSVLVGSPESGGRRQQECQWFLSYMYWLPSCMLFVGVMATSVVVCVTPWHWQNATPAWALASVFCATYNCSESPHCSVRLSVYACVSVSVCVQMASVFKCLDPSVILTLVLNCTVVCLHLLGQLLSSCC